MYYEKSGDKIAKNMPDIRECNQCKVWSDAYHKNCCYCLENIIKQIRILEKDIRINKPTFSPIDERVIELTILKS